MQEIVRKIKNLWHLFQAVSANIYYGFPGRKLKMIGVTGTDGKTTTASLIYHILQHAGKRVSVITTVYAKVGKKKFDTGLHSTTPGSFTVQRLLKLSVDAGDEFFILETTSHALDQKRVWGIKFVLSVLTNITHEHLDYHLNYANYLKTKAELLLLSSKAIINRDDKSYEQIMKILGDTTKVATYGLANKSDFSIDLGKELNQSLADFNKYNYLAAYAAARSLGAAHKEIISAMQTFKLPIGRLEVVYKGKFMIIVDFAHTPNAIAEALKTVKNQFLKNKGRLIHVFGSAGLRDVTKRPLMGEASANYSDIIILTEEDYRTENPENICEQIGQGIKKSKKNYTVITNRLQAIRKALEFANENDVIIITGKGHELSLCRGKTEHPWSDIKAVKKLIAVKT